MPCLRPPKYEFDGEYYREIEKVEYPLRKVMSKMRSAGFEIKKTYRVFEIAWHRFFVLEGSEK